MADESKTSLTRHLSVSVDRTALRQAIAGLGRPENAQDWCIACGAGRSASPLDKIEVAQATARELLGGKNIAEVVAGLKQLGPQAWCIACGAGKGVSPLDTLGDPAAISDEIVDVLASRLISSLRVG